MLVYALFMFLSVFSLLWCNCPFTWLDICDHVTMHGCIYGGVSPLVYAWWRAWAFYLGLLNIFNDIRVAVGRVVWKKCKLNLCTVCSIKTIFFEILWPTLYWLNNWHEDDTQAQSQFWWSKNRCTSVFVSTRMRSTSYSCSSLLSAVAPTCLSLVNCWSYWSKIYSRIMVYFKSEGLSGMSES